MSEVDLAAAHRPFAALAAAAGVQAQAVALLLHRHPRGGGALRGLGPDLHLERLRAGGGPARQARCWWTAGSWAARPAGEGERPARRGAGGVLPRARRAARRVAPGGRAALPPGRGPDAACRSRSASCRWEGELLAAGGPPPLTVIAPVAEGGVVNVTQKWAGLLAFGKLAGGGAPLRARRRRGRHRLHPRLPGAAHRLALGVRLRPARRRHPAGGEPGGGLQRGRPRRATRTRCGWAASFPVAARALRRSTRPTCSTRGRCAPPTGAWTCASAHRRPPRGAGLEAGEEPLRPAGGDVERAR